MRLNSGCLVSSAEDWQVRRHELLDLARNTIYGPLPPTPRQTQVSLLHEGASRTCAGGRILSLRVTTEARHCFTMRLLLPATAGPHPVLLHGDACWGYVTDAAKCAVLGRGYALAEFNRVEVMSDLVPALVPQTTCASLTGYTGGAIAAWAWGLHRGVDALTQINAIDAQHIAIVGHSRGGKAAILAGASDTRIAFTSANNSGAGGAGCWRFCGTGAETLADITAAFPHWFSSELQKYQGKELELPFDQHFLKALIAPRYLLTTEALDDLWANPSGSWRTHQAARQVFEFLGVPSHIAMVTRPGGHGQEMTDWETLLNHMDLLFKGIPLPLGSNENGFENVDFSQS